MIHPCVRIGLSVVACSALLGACKDDGITGPRGPRLALVAGAEGTDVVLATPVQALVVEVHGDDGRPAAGLAVRFETTPIDPAQPYWGSSMLVASVESKGFGGISVDTTDERGRALALVHYGTKTGIGRILVKVPELGLVDTAAFTIMPGAAARVRALPKDTTLFVGAAFTMRSVVTDRFDNPRTDPVTVSRLSGGVEVQGNIVTTRTEGLARVLAEAAGFSDTATITVVPQGVLAVARAHLGVATVNLDGSAYRAVTGTAAQYVRWAPDGSAISFDNGYNVPANIVTLNGVVRPVRQSSAGSEAEMYPVYSPDGAWVYFSPYAGGGVRLWRARPDGTEAAPLNSAKVEDDFYPSPSPDGTRLAYVRRTGGARDFLRILDLNTGAVSTIDVAGHAPAWSPLGDLIAFVDLQAGSVLKVMRPDGSGQRQVSPGGGYEMAVAWSPNGAWLIAYHQPTQRIHLVDVATGTAMPLAFSAGMRSPSWKP